MNLTRQQKIAIRHPCFEADECSNERYFWRSIDSTVSLGLTVNIGME